MMSDKVSLRDIMSISEKTNNEISALRKEINQRVDDVEKDVRILQNFNNRALGVMGVFSAFTSLVATYLWNKITQS